VRRNASAYAALVRVPNLFTAPPDVLAGAALAVAAGATVSPSAVATLAVASAMLYAGGTALNDYFDAPVDAVERPERPIPSGRVSRPVAGLVGAASLAGGVAVALLAGADSGVAAGAVAVSVVAYDGLLEAGPASVLLMGAARGLNVVVGTTAATASAVPSALWILAGPVAVAVYVAGVTHLAAEEATGVDRGAVTVAGVGTAVAGVTAVALLATAGGDAPAAATLTAFALVCGFLLVVGRALRRAYRRPSPETVGPVVGTCVVALVPFEAAVAGVAGVAWTLAALAFAVPAVGLSGAFDVS
jgi:4-hydroxybenzoate polyprenyltransferase